MKFEWDSVKADANKKKHGISFDMAITAFDDPYAMIAPDPDHSEVEEREWLIGKSDAGVLVVVFTRRHGNSVHRFITARRANRKERTLYETYKNISV